MTSISRCLVLRPAEPAVVAVRRAVDRHLQLGTQPVNQDIRGVRHLATLGVPKRTFS